MYALIQSGVVHEIIQPLLREDGTQVPLADIYSAELVADIVPADNTVQQGDLWNGQSFSRPPAPPAPTLAQQALAAINAGLTITLSGSLMLAATVFPTDLVTTGKIGAVITTLNTTKAFPGGATTYPMKDAAGVWHTFTAAQYTTVAAAIAAYAAANDLIADGNPLNATALPAASVSLTV